MAELIASKSRSSTRKLPSSIFQVLDRVIRLREAFAVLLDHSAPSPAGTAADPESDKTHHHFVNILKQCRAILGASSASTTSLPTTPEEPATARQRLSSAFAALQLYEPSQSFLAGATIITPSAVNYFLAEDDAAIDLTRRLENEVTPLLDRVRGVGKLLARHYRTAVAAEGMTLPGLHV